MLKQRLKALFLMLLITALYISVLPAASAQISSTIRVYLKRLGISDTMHIETVGSYMLEDESMFFADGTQLDVSLRNGKLVLHTGTAAIRMGERIRLVRCDDGESVGLKINGSNLYEGDLQLDIVSDAIRPILFIHIEDYLLGVVPFEMGDSFPLEALKAQAIAARTYALRKSGSDQDYDVEDTTNDQAYRGRTTNSPLSEQAVRETEGLCGTYNGRLAQCFYSASNGGQTELGQHVWPTSEPDAYGYMSMRDDPYDYENDASMVKRFTLPKNAKKGGINEALHQVLVTALSDDLMRLGMQTEADCVRIDEILNAVLLSPRFEGESRLMTEMQLTMRISVRECTYRDASGSDLSGTASMTPGPSETPSPTPRPTSTPSYTEYAQLSDAFTVTIPIFPTLEQAMGLSISTAKNELYSIIDIGSSYLIESRRYGHGVGMSQRGAEQMAREYGMTYTDILAFYYPGMGIERYELVRQPVRTPDMHVFATPAPTASPTPRPTLMPVSRESMPKGSYLAEVANIGDDSSLNLREAPSLSSDIVRRLYKNQQLIVLNVSRDGWAHVKTDLVEGYVRSEYLQAVE